MAMSLSLDAHRTLWLTEISKANFDDQGLDNAGIGGDGGLFFVLEDTGEDTFEVLAKAVSKSRAARFFDLFAERRR